MAVLFWFFWWGKLLIYLIPVNSVGQQTNPQFFSDKHLSLDLIIGKWSLLTPLEELCS